MKLDVLGVKNKADISDMSLTLMYFVQKQKRNKQLRIQI